MLTADRRRPSLVNIEYLVSRIQYPATTTSQISFAGVLKLTADR